MDESIKVIQISEVGFLIGENQILLINKNIIHVIAVGEQTTEMAKLYKDICLKLGDLVKGKVNYLIDLNKCGKNSPKARETWNIISGEEKTKKVAIFGINPVAKVIAAFVIGLAKTNNQRFFTTKDEALNWLLGK